MCAAASITLDGHDIRELTLESLRRQISIVLQDVFLFHGTVRENILFGRPDATGGGNRRGGQDRQCPRVHHRTARWLRHADRRARRQALGRAEAAPVHRPGRAQGRAHPDPRRSHLVGGYRDRAPDPAGAGAPDARAAPPSSSPTASRPSATRTRSWCWKGNTSKKWARTTN